MTRPLPDFAVSELEYLNTVDCLSMTNDDAVVLGLFAVQVIQERDLNLAVQIVLNGEVVFMAKLRSTNSDNDPWLAGKAAVATRFGESSLLVKLRHLEAGTPFADRPDIDHDTFKAYGGSIPLRVGGLVVGTITMSGEPDVIDHEVAADALMRFVASRM